MPLNPFVVVPPTINAAGLAETKPFLMAAIKTVASFRSLRSMRAQTYYLMKHLSDHILIRSERSLDLLQGLIVIISWYQYHCFIHAQLSNLVGLATSLISDMGLTRPKYIPGQFDPNGPKAHTADEKRAFAGVWFNSSVYVPALHGLKRRVPFTDVRQCIYRIRENRQLAIFEISPAVFEGSRGRQ
jgi:hypothetical protein